MRILALFFGTCLAQDCHSALRADRFRFRDKLHPRKSLWKKSLAFRKVERTLNGNVDATKIEIGKAIHLTG